MISFLRYCAHWSGIQAANLLIYCSLSWRAVSLVRGCIYLPGDESPE
jgi:hypothetical protein